MNALAVACLVPLLLAQAIAEPPVIRTVPVIPFAMGASNYGLPLPEGYCSPASVSPVIARDVTNEGGNTLSMAVYLERCNAIRRGIGDQEFLVIKYFKDIRLNAKSRATFIEDNAPAIRSDRFMRYLESDEVIDRVERNTERDTGVAVEANAAAQPLGHDDSCIYTGSRLEVRAPETGTTTTLLLVACVTELDKRLLTISASTREDSGRDFVDLARTLKGVVDSISAG